MAAPNPNPDAFMETFNQELERLRRLEESIDPAIGRIREKTGQIAAVVNQIHGALEALTVQVTAIADRIRAAQQEREELRRRIAELEARPNQDARIQELQARVDQLTRIITDATPQLTQLGDRIIALMGAADEGGITQDQIAAITRDVEAIGEQTRALAAMLLPEPPQQPPVVGGRKKARRSKQSRRTMQTKKMKHRRQKGGYNWISRSSASRSKSRSYSRSKSPASSRSRRTKKI